MTDLEDLYPLSDEGRHNKNFAMQMRQKNTNNIAAIEQMGGAVEITVARLEHFFDSLVAMGIISNDDRWTEERSWQIDLNKQLKDMRQRMEEIRQAAKDEAKRPRLVLPPHVKG